MNYLDIELNLNIIIFNLLVSLISQLGDLFISYLKRKAKIKDMDKFRNELRKANFSSTRGKFSFDKNHHPIQDIYVREVIKEGKILTNKIVSVGLKNHSNVYVSECNM